MDNKLDLSKEYNFEGNKYKEIDLSGLNNLTTMDMERAQQAMTRQGQTGIPELNIVYIESLAIAATGLPVEFFKGLPIKDATALRNAVTAFLM